jgi:uncharacterized protein
MRKVCRVVVTNTTKGTIVGDHIRVADTSVSRAIGLLGVNHLDPGDGLWIKPSSGVHTVGMRFPIDIVALNGQMKVLGVWEHVGGFRFAGLRWKTRTVLELPVGTIAASRIEVHDQLAAAH